MPSLQKGCWRTSQEVGLVSFYSRLLVLILRKQSQAVLVLHVSFWHGSLHIVTLNLNHLLQPESILSVDRKSAEGSWKNAGDTGVPVFTAGRFLNSVQINITKNPFILTREIKQLQ